MSAEAKILEYLTTLNENKDELLDQAISLASGAQSAVYGFAVPNKDIPDFVDFTVEFDELDAPTEASTFHQTLTVPTERSRLEPISDVDVNEANFPEKPTLTDTDDIDQPTGGVPTFTDTIPNVSTATRTITVPDIQSFNPLTLLDVDLPDTDIDVVLPTFNAQAPVFLGEDSYDLREQTKSDYEDALNDIRAIGGARLTTFLNQHFPTYARDVATLDAYLDDLINGRTTSWTTITELLTARRSAVDTERDALDEQLRRSRARRGSVVDMSLTAAGLRIEQGVYDAKVKAAYEIAERVADREQKHLEVVLNLMSALRQAALQAWLSYHNIMLAENEQALQFAREMLNAAVQSHNLAVARYNNDINLYRVEADVFEQKLKSALVEYELLEAELRVLTATNQANESIIAARRAEIEAEGQKIDLYTAEIRGLAAELELRKFPLEIFQAKIRAFEAKLAGRRTEADIYQALVSGQRGIVEADALRVRLYAEEVDAWRARIQAFGDKQSVTIAANKDLREQIAMELEVIRTELLKDEAKNQDALAVAQQAIVIWQERQRIALGDAERRSGDERISVNARVEYDKMIADYILGVLNHGFQRAKAIADVQNQAAATIGDLGAAALAANGSNLSLINQTINS